MSALCGLTSALGSVALAAVIASPAIAADYAAPRRAATFAEPAASWTGFYIGGNIGAVWGNTDPGLTAGCNPQLGGTTTGFGVLPNLPTGPAPASCTLNVFGGGGAFTNVATPVSAIGTQPFHNNGWEGGLQLGFNYQYQWAVFGIEADFQAFRPKGSANYSGSYPLNANTVACSVTGPAAAQSNFGGCGFGFTESSDPRGNV